jgi:3,4-dihydroxy 2-butanone 4-phosphate synthase/GTP cyclohydrolase II
MTRVLSRSAVGRPVIGQSHHGDSNVEFALSALRAGRAVLLVNETIVDAPITLSVAASLAQPPVVAEMVRYSSGFLCVAVTDETADRLGLPLTSPVDERSTVPRFTVTVDAAAGITTGISASDRATTIRLLGTASTRAEQLTRPGHIQPVRVRSDDRNDAGRNGIAATALRFARLAGLPSAMCWAHVVSPIDPRRMATTAELPELVASLALSALTVEQINADE